LHQFQLPLNLLFIRTGEDSIINIDHEQNAAFVVEARINP